MIGRWGHSEGGKSDNPVRVGTVRKGVKLAMFLLIAAGLFAGIGWGSYSSMGIDAIAYLCPLGAFEALLAAKVAIPRFVVAIVVMAAAIALLGRAFCAWACPVPSVEAFFRPRKKAHADARAEKAQATVEAEAEAEAPAQATATAQAPTQAETEAETETETETETEAPGSREILAPLADAERALLAAGCGDGDAVCGSSAACASCLAPVGGARDGFRLDTRHGVLLGALASAAVFGFPVFCLICPVGLSVATVVAVWQAFVGHAPSWSLLVFPLILVLELVVFRKWCHALCPLGALMSLLGQGPLFKPRVDEHRCLRARGVDCCVCVNACPEKLDPHSPRLPECTKCGACVDVCPARAIAMPAFSHKKQERIVPRKGN